MKIFILILSLMTSTVYAKEKIFGTGVMLGEPSAVSLQFRHNSYMVDLGVGYSLSSEAIILADHKILLPKLLPALIRKPSPITAYWGLGGFMRFENDQTDKDDLALGVRMPLGLEYLLPKDPFGFFLEVVPSLKVITESDFGLQGSLGARYYF